jgi:hypothetical protein
MGNDDEAEATKWTGDAEVAPGTGEFTVTPAKEAAARIRFKHTSRTVFFTAYPPVLRSLS